MGRGPQVWGGLWFGKVGGGRAAHGGARSSRSRRGRREGGEGREGCGVVSPFVGEVEG
ncbi:MAG: hypothetical protein SPG27_12470 [Butyricimonas virosa]|nr:hypothetical protein [Butyricimonas virosa]